MSLLDLTTDEELVNPYASGLPGETEPADTWDGVGGPAPQQPENTGPAMLGGVRSVDWGGAGAATQANGTLLDRVSDADLFGPAQDNGMGDGGASLLDRTPDSALFGGPQLVVSGATPVPVSPDQGSAVTRAYESPTGQAVAAGVLESAPGLAVRGVERAAGLPVAAPPQLGTFWQRAVANLTSLGLDIPVLYAPAGRVARLGIERAVGTLAEKVGQETAERLIFSKIGAAAQAAAAGGLTFSAADAAKAALEEAQTPTATVGSVAGAAAGAAARGGVVGAGFGLAGAIPNGVLRTLAELGVMTGVPAAMEGRAPTAEELIQGGLSLGALKLGYYLSGVAFPGGTETESARQARGRPGRTSEDRLSPEAEQFLENAPSDLLGRLRQRFGDRPEFVTKIDAILAARGEGGATTPAGAPAPSAEAATTGPTAFLPGSVEPVSAVPPASSPAGGPALPSGGAPEVGAPPAEPITPPAAVSPPADAHVLYDGQKWWANANGQSQGPFDEPEEAQAALEALLQPTPPVVPAPAEPTPEPGPLSPPQPAPPAVTTPPQPSPGVAKPATPRTMRGRPEPLDPDVAQRLRGMIVEINEGQAGSRRFDQETGAFAGTIPSTYPRWMTSIARDKRAALASIESALGGGRGEGATRAIQAAQTLIQDELARYPEAPPPTEPAAVAPEGQLGPETEVTPGDRVATPEGAGTVSDASSPFGDVTVDLDDDGSKAFMPGELGPEQEVGAPPTAVEGSPSHPAPVRPPNERWTNDPGAIPGEPSLFLADGGDIDTAPVALIEREIEGKPGVTVWDVAWRNGAPGRTFNTMEEAAAAAEAEVHPPERLQASYGSTPLGSVGGPRYEKTPLGDQAIIPGSDVPQVTGGRIRGRPSGPAITSADAGENLFNQEATAERARLEASQGELSTEIGAGPSTESIAGGEVAPPLQAQEAAPPAPDKAVLVPTREGIKVVPVDRQGEPVGPSHMAVPRAATPRGRPSGPLGPIPGLAPPSEPAEGGEGFTRTGSGIDNLPKESPPGEEPYGLDAAGNTGHVVGRDPQGNLYVAFLAGSSSNVRKIPRADWTRYQQYWQVGNTVHAKTRALANREWIQVEGPVELLAKPRLEDGMIQVAVRTADGRELSIATRGLTDLPVKAEAPPATPGPQPAGAVPPSQPAEPSPAAPPGAREQLAGLFNDERIRAIFDKEDRGEPLTPQEQETVRALKAANLGDMVSGATTITPAPTKALPAGHGPEDPRVARIQKLVSGFAAHLEAGIGPDDAGDLKRQAAELLGMDPKVLGADPDLVDEAFDAFEGAVNLTVKPKLTGLTFPQQMALAREAESALTGRSRTIALMKRQQFSTPLPLAVAAAHAVDVKDGETVVEPTAGTGNLLVAFGEQTPIVANEIDPRRAEVLRALGHTPTVTDALFTPLHGSVVVMNPPWGKYTAQKYGPPIPMPYGDPVDVAERFIVKSLREMPEGGRLSAILPTTIIRNPHLMKWLRETQTLRAVIQSPPGAYDTRGTRVDSVLLVVDKGRIPDAPDPVRASPETWDDYEAAVARLGAGGSHGRVGGAVSPEVRTGAAQRLDTARPGGAWSPAPEVGQAEAPNGPVARPGEPEHGEAVRGGRQPVQGPPEVRPGRPPEGGTGKSAPDLVASGAGAAPGATGPSEQPRTGVEGQPPALPQRLGDAKFSYANEREFRESLDSRVFTPAPLRAASGAHPHPRLVVKTRSLAGAKLPALVVQSSSDFVRRAYDQGLISDQQLDYGVLPALQANARGHGFLSAADVGVGKTRIGGAVMAEWLELGQAKRILYATASGQNVGDVREELDALAGGTFPWPVVDVTKFKEASLLYKGGPRQPIPVREPAVYIVDRYNLAAYADSLKELFLDAIVGDEAHLLRNVDGSKTGMAWLALQNDALRRGAKFLYLTATPATDIDDMKHFVGLREWTAESFEDWKRRVAGETNPRKAADAMETRLDDLQAIYNGWAGAKDESIGRQVDQLRKQAEREQLFTGKLPFYSEAVNLLENWIRNTPGAAEAAEQHAEVEAKSGRRKKGGAASAFGVFISPAETEQVMRELATKGKYDSVDLWRAGVEFEVGDAKPSPAQREEYRKLVGFFGELNQAFREFAKMNKKDPTGGFGIFSKLQAEAKRRLADYRLDAAIREAKAALARGEQPVISVIEFHAGSTEHGNIPAAINTINTRAIDTDEESGEITSDEEIPEALIRRQELMDAWREFRTVRSTVDVVRDAFGKANVAVITGDQTVKERRANRDDFQAGRKTVALISGAGKTGISLHHTVLTDKGPAKGRRILIVSDYEWSAQQFKQELGRVDRAGQITAPKIMALSTGGAGEKKFLSTIANRMRNLGAMSKGSAESASSMAEFELGGTVDTAAMRRTFAALPPDIKEQFLSRSFWEFTSHGKGKGMWRPAAGEPEKATLRDFLLNLQWLPMEDGDKVWTLFERTRELVMQQQAQLEDLYGVNRTASSKGEILRTTELREDLVLHEIQDAAHHKFGLLQGVITPYIQQILPFLSDAEGKGLKRWLTIEVGDDQVSGLRVGPTHTAGLARAFGASIHKLVDTVEGVLTALRAGDRIKLFGKAGQQYTLRERPSDGRIAIEGAKMADKAALFENGAALLPIGNSGLWVISNPHGDADELKANLAKFLLRFPAHQPAVNPAQGETPDEATQANLGEEGGVLLDLLAAPYLAAKLAIGAFTRYPSALGRNPRSGRPGTHQAADPDVERAVTTTRGVTGQWLETLGQLGDAIGRTFVWEWDIRGYPLEQDEIRLFQASRRHVGQFATRDVIGVVHHLRVPKNDTASHDNFDLFARIIVLRDFVARASQPERFPGGLPFGVTLEQVEPELRRLEGVARQNVGVQRALQAHARLMEAERQDMAARGKLSPDRAIADYFPHLVLEYQERFKGGHGTGRRRMGEPSRPFLRGAEGSAKAVETDYLRAMYTHRFQVRYANAVDDFALKVIRRHDKMASLPKDLRRTLEPGKTVDINGVEHTVYQYKKGRAIYQAQTAPERVIAEAIAAGEDEIAIAELRQRPTLGAYYKRYLVPTPIAQRFERWGVEQEKDIFDALRTATHKWKGLTIGFWGSVGHLVNLQGDLLNIARVDPASWAQLPRATAEVIRWARGTPSSLIDLLDKYDILQAGYVGRELNMSDLSLEIARYPELRDFLTRRQRILADAKQAALWPFFEAAQYREAVPRVALALSLLKRVERGENLKRQARGLDIRNLPPEQAALKLAREASVDYGRFTPTENRWFRALWFPFYSWTAGNTPNWLRWLVAAPLSATVILGVRLLLEYWNQSTEDKRRVENGLPDYQRYTPHVNTGFYGKDGKMLTIYLPGEPLNDVFTALGLDRSFARLLDMMRGEITLGKATRAQLSDITWGPMQRVLGLATPAKAAVEAVANFSLFTGRPIVPKALVGTGEDVGRRLRYVAETAIRPLRETRTILEQSGRTQGYDWLTGRIGLGLPLIWTEPEVGDARRLSRQYNDALAETIDQALTEFRGSATYKGMSRIEQDEAIRTIADQVRRAFTRKTPNPVPPAYWRQRRLSQ